MEEIRSTLEAISTVKHIQWLTEAIIGKDERQDDLSIPRGELRVAVGCEKLRLTAAPCRAHRGPSLSLRLVRLSLGTPPLRL